MCIFDAHFSGTLLIDRLVAVVTIVAFDRGRQCDRDFVVAQIRITCAYGTEKRRCTAISRIVIIARRAPTART